MAAFPPLVDKAPGSADHTFVRLFDYEAYVKSGKNITPPNIDQLCYILPMDKDGKALYQFADSRFQQLEAWAKDSTEIYLMCHGWNNTPAGARALYREVFSGIATERERAGLPRALFLAIYWPSIILAETFDDFWARSLTDVDLDPAQWDVESFAESLRGDGYTGSVLRQLADAAQEVALKQASAATSGNDGSLVDPTTVKDNILLAHAKRAGKEREDAICNTILPILRNVTGDLLDIQGVNGLVQMPQCATTVADVAEIVSNVEPFDIDESSTRRSALATPLQLLTVYSMKNRAGVVGANGMATLLKKLLQTRKPVHTLGHSFGCKVVLEAMRVVCPGQGSLPTVASVSLLEPALSRWAFSTQSPGILYGSNNVNGVYIDVPKSVTTNRIHVFYSNEDYALMVAYPAAYGVSPTELPTSVMVADRGPDDVTADVSLDDAKGSTLAAAALGAHGPDMAHSEQPVRLKLVDVAADVRLLNPPKATFMGIKGDWGHGGLGKGGWCRPTVTRVLFCISQGACSGLHASL